MSKNQNTRLAKELVKMAKKLVAMNYWNKNIVHDEYRDALEIVKKDSDALSDALVLWGQMVSELRVMSSQVDILKNQINQALSQFGGAKWELNGNNDWLEETKKIFSSHPDVLTYLPLEDNKEAKRRGLNPNDLRTIAVSQVRPMRRYLWVLHVAQNLEYLTNRLNEFNQEVNNNNGTPIQSGIWTVLGIDKSTYDLLMEFLNKFKGKMPSDWEIRSTFTQGKSDKSISGAVDSHFLEKIKNAVKRPTYTVPALEERVRNFADGLKNNFNTYLVKIQDVNSNVDAIVLAKQNFTSLINSSRLRKQAEALFGANALEFPVELSYWEDKKLEEQNQNRALTSSEREAGVKEWVGGLSDKVIHAGKVLFAAFGKLWNNFIGKVKTNVDEACTGLDEAGKAYENIEALAAEVGITLPVVNNSEAGAGDGI